MDQHKTLDLVPARHAPRLARTFTADTLEAWAIRAEDVDVALLVVSELVTNSLLHAPTSRSITLELSRRDDHVRVRVSDDSPHQPPPAPSPPPWTAERGRGVVLVESLADRWGTEPRQPAGKTVWCELRTEAAGNRV